MKVTWLRKALSVLKLIVLVAIIAGIPAYIVLLNPDLIEKINTLEEAQTFLMSFVEKNDFTKLYLSYFGLQVLQIIIFIIPGQFINMAAGWLLGFPAGFLLSLAGAAAGTVITYYLSIILGQSAMRVLIEPQKFNKFLERLNSERAYIAVLILYMVPGLPKDFMGYVAGVSNMKFLPFLVLSLIGRAPALAVSIMTGSMIHKESYIGVILLAALMVVLFVIGLINRNRLINFIDHGYEKYVSHESETEKSQEGETLNNQDGEI